jgi:hypothetical protein
MDLGVPAKCIFDLVLDVTRLYMRLQRDAVEYAVYAGKPADKMFSGDALVLPVDFATERNPAILDFHDDGVSWHGGAPLQNADGTMGDFVIVGLLVAGKANLEAFGQCLNAPHALDGLLGRQFLCIAAHMPAKGNHTIFHGDADMGGVHRRRELQLVHNVLTQGFVIHRSLLQFFAVTILVQPILTAWQKLAPAPLRQINPRRVARPGS